MCLYWSWLNSDYCVQLCVLTFIIQFINCFTYVIGSEVKEIADSPRPSENASGSPVRNTGLVETSTDDVVAPTSESSTEIVITSDNSNETPRVNDKVNEHNEIESDSKEEVNTSKESVDGQNDTTRLADAEFDQGNSADDSIESSGAQEKVSSC